MSGVPSAIDVRPGGVTDPAAPAAHAPTTSPRQGVRPWRWIPARWVISAALFLLLSSLSIGLARAERRLEAEAQTAVRPRVPHRAPDVIQWGGLAGSLLTAGAILQALRHREREAKQNRQYLRALKLLNRIAAAITAHPDAAPRVLWQLAEAARRLLAMDRAGVLLLDGGAQTLELLAFSGDMPPEPPRIYRLQDLPACRAALGSGRVLFAGDVEREVRVRRTGAGAPRAGSSSPAHLAGPAESSELASPANSKVARYFRARSLILIPLQRSGRRIGLVTLAGSRPRRFTEAERRLAELLAAQASVTLVSARLYARLSTANADSERLLRQRDALAAVNDAVISAPDLGEALRRVAHLTPAALEVDACGVLLVREEAAGPEAQPVLELAAASPPLEGLIGRRIDGPDAIIEQVFRTAEPAVVPDLSAATDLHPSWDHVPGLRSVLAVPLFDVGGKPLAVVSLACRKRVEFGPGQVEAAKLFASRVAAAIENARLWEQARALLEQTRCDADTRQMLLRELNHRVKNNLAGIVTLLSLEAPEMSGAAREWLDRAIGRIRSMAGAHEMFAGGAATIDLADLVSRTLAGLSVAMPEGVRAVVELGGAPVPLPAEQVIGLAMVLHELCFNAAVHGLKSGGTLTIRATRTAGEVGETHETTAAGRADGTNGSEGAGCLRIDVINGKNGEGDGHERDDPWADAGAPAEENGSSEPLLPPSAIPAPADETAPPEAGQSADEENAPSPEHLVGGSGIGLALVQGLVKRELRGRFSLRHAAGGGTIATVEFPFSPDSGAHAGAPAGAQANESGK